MYIYIYIYIYTYMLLADSWYNATTREQHARLDSRAQKGGFQKPRAPRSNAPVGAGRTWRRFPPQ